MDSKSDSKLKDYQSGQGCMEAHTRSWYVADKQGRLFHMRTHPTDFGRYVLLIQEGDKFPVQFDFSSRDIDLLRDLLNLMEKEKKEI